MSLLKQTPTTVTGKAYWRSLNELADTPEFKQFLHREFPENADDFSNPVTRRTFITLMGASFALAGLTGCRRPVEKIIPYVVQPESVVPGVPKFYATTMPIGTQAYGILVESHEGRPTKIEGNPAHPASLGGTNVWAQAAMLGLYDPDRSQAITQDGAEKSKADFVTFWQGVYNEALAQKGQGMAIVSETFASPTLARLKKKFLETFPQAKWVTFEPVGDEAIFAGLNLATGQDLQVQYDLKKAKAILALDADLLCGESDSVAMARGFADGRRIMSENETMNRLYAVESNYSVTGSAADHRLRLQSRQIGAFAAALALELAAKGASVPGVESLQKFQSHSFDKKWLGAVADDLLQNKGASVVAAGRHQPAEVHALVCAMNLALGNAGQTVFYRERKDVEASNRAQLAELVKDSAIQTLIILGGNPAYDAPADADFAGFINKVKQAKKATIHLSLYRNETSALCNWHINQAHFLESWGDARSADGSASVIQPLIAPLFDGLNSVEFLGLLATGQTVNAYESVRETWREAFGGGLGFEAAWQKVVHDGIKADSALPVVMPTPNPGNLTQAFSGESAFPTDAAGANNLEIVFAASPRLYDGRFSNNGWLQELPDNLTKIVWDNVALMSPKTATGLGLGNNLVKGKLQNEVVTLQYNGRSVAAPIFVLPGHADDSVTVYLGYGRAKAGRVGDGVGFNAYQLQTLARPTFDLGLKVSPTGETQLIASTQDHGSMEGRPIIREASLEDYKQKPTFAPDMVKHPPLESLWKDWEYTEGYQWGMAIDLNTCIGCGVCTIACQSENNIPIVGKIEAAKGREMHWMRIDRYFAGDAENPEVLNQPMACVHCENAPCEQVCPVAATTHTTDGLNAMVYNRCVGTRYCANNCPYKVRRFNYGEYQPESSGFWGQDKQPEILKLVQNPDVTVRMRGVMEKCTYCIQRIQEKKSVAKYELRDVRDGEIVTACQQACPTGAIVFGNINDKESRVRKLHENNRSYFLLSELNVKPRTTFLAKVRNPNPTLA